MKKQWMVVPILLMVFASVRENSRAQDIMCPLVASGSAVTPPPPSFHVGVILVQFSDEASNSDARGGYCKIHEPNGNNHYTYQMYYDHLFSTNFRTNPFGQQTHDQEAVFGSMKEYFEEMSYGNFTITGDIINPHPNPNANPQWVTLTQTKAWWISQTYDPQALLNAALAVSGYSIAGYDKVMLLYAGREESGGLQPSAYIGGNVLQSSEKNPGPRGRTQTTGTFYGIGTHAHEFAHNLGLNDLQIDWAPWRGGVREFDLMATGNQGFMDGNYQNSAIGGWHAPTPLSGYSKLILGWANYTDISTDQIINFPSFDESSNLYVRFINDANHNDWYEGEYFIIENRRPAFSGGGRTFDGDMVNGLLIFHRANTVHPNTQLNLDVVEANGIDEVGQFIGGCKNAHLFPGTTNNTAFTPLSTPSSDVRGGGRSGFALTNIAANGTGITANAYINYLISNSTDATTSNSSRKLVRDGSGNYHLVYESGGEIYYQYSTTGNNNWLGLFRLSAGNGSNKFPSIAERSGKLYVFWQRKTGTNTYATHFRHHNGANWEALRTVNGSITSSNDLTPVLAVSTPAASFEMMVVYRINSGLRFRRSTSSNGASWEAAATVTSTAGARNPSLVYKANDYGYFNVTWDDGSNIKHQIYYGGTTWGAATTVSTGTSAYNHQYSSYALSANNDRHIVWQAFEAVDYQKQVIYHNKNLTNIFTVFASRNWDHLKPSGTGLTSGALTVLCHDSNNNVRKRYYNGSYWQSGSEGTVIASNSLEASASIANPPGAVAKAVWRSSGSAPYTLAVGPSGGLSKSNADEDWVYNRRVVFSLNNSATLAVQMGAVQLHSASGKNEQAFPFVSDQDSVKVDDLAAALNLNNLLLPPDADSLAFEVKIYGQDAGTLRNDQARALNLAFDLLSVETGLPLASIQLSPLNNTGVSRQSTRLFFPVQALRGRQIHLLPKVSNLRLAKLDGALVHVYEVIESGAEKVRAETPSLVVATQPVSFSARVYPNPFNPSTQIYFNLPSEGLVAVRVYDANGRVVKELFNGLRIAGEHSVIWDGRDELGRNVASGMYFSEVLFGEQRKLAKMILVR